LPNSTFSDHMGAHISEGSVINMVFN